MEEVITAVIGGLCVAIPSIIATISTNRRSTALITYRVDQLELKQDKHNTLIERTYRLEEDVKNLKEDVKELRK